MPSFEEIQKARISASFNTDEGLSELTKAEIIDIEKGGKRAMIGEKRTFAGREYIKTSDGWKFHGKGTGSKAQSHVAGALSHHVGEKKKEGEPEFVVEGTLDPTKPDYEEKLSNVDWDKTDITRYQQRREFLGKLPNGKFGIKYFSPNGKKSEVMELGEVDYTRNLKQAQEQHSKPTHKDATDYFVEEDDKHFIDTLDPDSGEKVFKPGDKVKYEDREGKSHKGTISDREHEDGDMFEVDKEGDEGEVEHKTNLKEGQRVLLPGEGSHEVVEVVGNMVRLSGKSDPVHISKLLDKNGDSVLKKE